MSDTRSLEDFRRWKAQQVPEPETSLVGATLRDMGRNALGPIGAPFVSDAETKVGGVAQDILRGIPSGLVAAAQGIGDLTARAGNAIVDRTENGNDYSVGEWLGDHAAKLYVQATTGQKIDPEVFKATQEAWINLSPEEREEFRDEHRGEQFDWLDQNVLSREARPEVLQPDSIVGGLTEGITQFMVPYAGVSRLTGVSSALNLFSKAGKTGGLARTGDYLFRNAVLGEAVAFSVFQGDEGRLSDLIDYVPFVGDDLSDTAVFSWLKTDESDSELEGRLKNLVEGSFLGPVADGVLTLFGRGMRAGARGILGEEPTGESAARVMGQMAETGEIPASIAEKLGLSWEQPQFNREGPERSRVADEFQTAGRSEREVRALTALADVVAAKWAQRNGKTVDDFYAKLRIEGESVEVDDLATGALRENDQGQLTLFQQAHSLADKYLEPAKPSGQWTGRGDQAIPKAFGKSDRTEVLGRIDSLRKVHEDPFSSDEAALAFMSDLFGGDVVPKIPRGLLEIVRDPNVAADRLRTMNPEQIEGFKGGQALGDRFREAYAQKGADEATTAELLLWGISSRGVSPFVHEAAAGDFAGTQAFEDLVEYMKTGESSGPLTEALAGYASASGADAKKAARAKVAELLSTEMPEASPGRGALHNINAFAIDMALKLAQKTPSGETVLAAYHRILADPNLNGRQKRRQMFEVLPEGHGIGLKVHSFILLVTGHRDLLVLDRVQVRNMFRQPDSKRFENFYDPAPSADAPGGGYSQVFDAMSPKALALQEAMEDSLSGAVTKAYDAAGLDGERSLGRFHWDLWNIDSLQAAGHGSLDNIVAKAGGAPDPNAASIEGKRSATLPGVRYRLASKTMEWSPGNGKTYVFTPEAFKTMGNLIRRPDAGVVPDEWVQRATIVNPTTGTPERKLWVTGGFLNRNVFEKELTDGNWFESVGPEYRDRLFKLVEAHSTEVLSDSPPAGGTGSAVAGGRGRPEAIQSLSQDARGRIDFDPESGGAVIRLFESADGSTAVHELGHFFRRSLSETDPDLSGRFDAWVGAEPGKPWSVPQEEQFAQAFELYVATGKAPSPELEGAFETLKNLVREAYQNLKHFIKTGELNIKLKPEVQDMFDELFAPPFAKADITNPRPSDRPPNTPLQAAQDVRASYVARTGQPDPGPQPYVRVDTPLAGRIADAYDDLQHNPSDPAVKASYDALATETKDQYEHVVNSGTRFVFTSGDPYTSSQGLMDDIEANGRMRVFRTEEGSLPADHPLAAKTGIMATDAKTGEQFELVYNDLFRAVHDYFGHAAGGYQFGARGEENAWVAHSRMYSEAARPAMTTETRGQNSWVNTSRKIRRADGSVPRKGDPDYVNPQDRPFAEQKAGLLPDWALEHPDLTPASKDTGLAAGLQKTLFQLKDKLDVAGLGRFHLAVASHTNLAKLQTSSDVHAFITAIDQATQGKIDDVIGDVQTLNEVLEEAAARGLDPEQLRRDLAKGAANVQRLPSLIVAGRAVKVALAEQLNKAAADVLAGKPGAIEQMIQAENALARVDTQVGILTKEAARATGSGRIAVPGVSDAAATAISKALSERQAVDSVLLGAADAAARKGDSALAAYLRGQAGGTGQERAKKFAKMIQDAQAIGKTDSAIRKAREAKDPSVVDAFLEAYKAFLLSGLKTFSINVLSGGLQTYMQATARILGAGTRLGTPGGRSDFKNASRYLINLHASMFDVVGMLTMNRSITGGYAPNLRQSAARTVKQESPNLYGSIQQAGGITSATESKKAIQAETFGLENDQAAGKAVNGIGRFVRLPFLVSMLGEEWWSTINYLAFIRTKAAEQADRIWDDTTLTQAEKHKAASAFIQEYTSRSFDQFGSAARLGDGSYSHADAVRYAQSANFMQDLEYGLGELILEAKRNPKYGAGAITDLILPFVKAPTNLIRTAARYSIGGAAVLRRTPGAPPLAQWEADKNRGEMILGGMLMTAAALLASEGAITGGGPVNADEREVLQQSGWRPYSFVRMGADGKKEYIQFSRADPQASVFGLVADLVEVIPYLNPEEADLAVAKALIGVAQNFSSKTYLRGLTESFQAITRPERFGKKFLQNMAANLVPMSSMGRSINATNAEYMTETYTFLDMVKQRIPGMAADLPPRRNLFGEPITPMGGYIPFTSGETAVGKMASPVAFSREVDDEGIQEMARLQAGFSMPGVTVDGVDITQYRTSGGQNAYDRYLELSGTIRANGKTMGQAVNALIQSPSYRNLPEPTGDPKQDAYNPRVRAIKTVMDGYRDAARSTLLREIPDLQEEIRRRKLGGATGQRRPGPSNSLDVIDRLLQ